MSNDNQQTENDSETKKRKKPNILSQFFIWWMCPVFIKGNKRDVQEEDLIITSKSFESDTQGDYFERYNVLDLSYTLYYIICLHQRIGAAGGHI